MYFLRTLSVIPKLPEKVSGLHKLAYNLWFSWNPNAWELFRRINGTLWEEVGHNPVAFLLEVQQEELEEAAQNHNYLKLYNSVMEDLDNYMKEESKFKKLHPNQANQVIAYFSAEFGIHESHPTYSGGLGLLAGDHCKAASDLGLPFVGVGLLYKSGYFVQRINIEGWQETEYPHFNYHRMPVKIVTNDDGSELVIPVELPGRTIFLKVWRMQVGRVNVYFLDADLSRNSLEDRALTHQLYGGNQEIRIAQEILLGIGGVKALRALGIHPRAWHINEGHSAFLLLERIRELVQNGIPLQTALEAVKVNTLFTTHTPVPAGHDVFSAELIDKYFGHYYEQLGMTREDFLNLGWDDDKNQFNMTLLAIRNSNYCNGVSKLHGQVTREMFQHFYKNIPIEEIPISSVTNGVHTATWLAPKLRALLDAYLKPGWYREVSRRDNWTGLSAIPPEELWAVHCKLKEKMVQVARNNLRGQRLRNEETYPRIREVNQYLDPDVLTIGFARRFATYKRANLLLKDKERLARLVADKKRPVQIIFAGKAHPADHPGQQLIKEICELTNQEPFRGRVVFLEGYDIRLARTLLQGVDVWLNTPRRPMEASGTSGQKAALNGVINCSVPDGWWPEAYNGENGFTIGNDGLYISEEIQDKNDAYSLFSVLEETIVPLYYDRDDAGIPRAWVELMKRSLETIPQFFNTERMVQEYCDKFYIPAIKRGNRFSKNNFAVAKQVQAFKKRLTENWHLVNIISVKTKGNRILNVGEEQHIEAVIKLGPLTPQDVSVEIFYCDKRKDDIKNVNFVAMSLISQLSEDEYHFSGYMKPPQGTLGYSVRVRPSHPDLGHHFELPLVTWAHAF
ncbi:alpha-glucan family phosphorylase [Desulfolucanica intricata]|uniref:alpha-glucan family phosphorylase n=1 Tax=Desulfolucanica intricata TaxID=1285191 RepID=UPI00082DFB57|nr:alpha-glucan family phosphorylase [Desulfolucanica intricata]